MILLNPTREHVSCPKKGLPRLLSSVAWRRASSRIEAMGWIELQQVQGS